MDLVNPMGQTWKSEKSIVLIFTFNWGSNLRNEELKEAKFEYASQIKGN